MLEAACGSALGKVRKSNEDNFLFCGKTLTGDNRGMKKAAQGWVDREYPACFGVFDGVGGERYGEKASFAAARKLRELSAQLEEYIIPEQTFLCNACAAMNDAVLSLRNQLGVDRMGTTAVVALFQPDEVYVCNLGDSRAYRLRRGVFQQLTKDDCPAAPSGTRSGGITQYLGADPAELTLEPHISKGPLLPEDRYLLCSDGLTDMLTNFEISDIMLTNPAPRDSVNALIRAALAKGGRDNITVIVCRVVRQEQ